jgi:hypothetical protein
VEACDHERHALGARLAELDAMERAPLVRLSVDRHAATERSEPRFDLGEAAVSAHAGEIDVALERPLAHPTILTRFRRKAACDTSDTMRWWPALAFLLLAAPGSAQDTTSAAPTDDVTAAYEAVVADRPTSGDASLLSGRTLGTGEVMIAAFAGWPGAFVQLELAPSSIFNIGIRAGFLYGSGLMGLVTGYGGELAVPMRIHVFGERDVDIAIHVQPVVSLGSGTLFGEQGIFGDHFGYGARLDLGARMGWEVDPRLTFVFGVDGGVGFSGVDPSGPSAIGMILGVLGAEVLVARDFMLFVEAQGGYGFAPDRAGALYFPAREVLRVVIGGAFLL